jgi:deazaflavin-dependent oxidoreductase (nitroreductase family)
VAGEEIRQALVNSREVQLTVTGRKSGGEITIPVWFVLEDDRLYLVPVHGTDSHWYKNVLKTPTVRLSAGGAEITAEARPITDPAKVEEVIDKFRAKYGADDVQAYYPKQDAAVEIPLA